MTWYYWVAYGLMMGEFAKTMATMYRDHLEASLKDVRIVLTDHRKEQDDPSDHLD